MTLMTALLCLFAFINTRLHAKPQKEQYLSSNFFKSLCEFCVTTESRVFNPKDVKRGNCIFVKTDYIEEFFLKLHPKIRYPYVLITHDSDYPAPKTKECAQYLNDKKLIAWFAQNVELIHPKLHPIPIGMGYSDLPRGRKSQLQKCRKSIPFCKKDKLLYLNHNIETYPKERSYVSQIFSNKPFCWNPGRKHWNLYLLDLARTKFVLSPRGNGLDCFRTWESLYMGSIPIVKASAMDKVFEGLPVLIVNDWTLVSERFLQKKYAVMKTKKYSSEKLFAPYWKNVINAYKKKARKKN